MFCHWPGVLFQPTQQHPPLPPSSQPQQGPGNAQTVLPKFCPPSRTFPLRLPHSGDPEGIICLTQTPASPDLGVVWAVSEQVRRRPFRGVRRPPFPKQALASRRRREADAFSKSGAIAVTRSAACGGPIQISLATAFSRTGAQPWPIPRRAAAGSPLLLVELGEREVGTDVEDDIEGQQDAHAGADAQLVAPEVQQVVPRCVAVGGEPPACNLHYLAVRLCTPRTPPFQPFIQRIFLGFQVKSPWTGPQICPHTHTDCQQSSESQNY